MVGNALGLFGAGVYLRAITASTGWATGTVSGAVTRSMSSARFFLFRSAVGSAALARAPSLRSAALRWRRASQPDAGHHGTGGLAHLVGRS
jgi:hypothetical protein